MKYILSLLLLLSLLTPFVGAYEFSEVHYDPLGSDANREWVEVYGEPLDGMQFIEGGNSHSLTFIEGECEHDCISIIADDALLFLEEYDFAEEVLLYDSSWSSLRNTGETIGLEQNGLVVLEWFYELVDASGESIQLEEGLYVSKQPTPGEIYRRNEAEVPEFGVMGSIFVLICAGLFVFRNRKE